MIKKEEGREGVKEDGEVKCQGEVCKAGNYPQFIQKIQDKNSRMSISDREKTGMEKQGGKKARIHLVLCLYRDECVCVCS